jgi:hypothetical protein
MLLSRLFVAEVAVHWVIYMQFGCLALRELLSINVAITVAHTEHACLASMPLHLIRCVLAALMSALEHTVFHSRGTT